MIGKQLAALMLGLTLIACEPTPEQATPDTRVAAVAMPEIVERYVKLILAIGEHEPGYVDAYYGPTGWADDVKTDLPDLGALKSEANALIAALSDLAPPDAQLDRQRLTFLNKQLIAAETRLRMLEGETFSFDEETRLLFDAVSPGVTEAELDAALAELDALIPGAGPLYDRYLALLERAVIPSDRLAKVFQTAIAECRARTIPHLALPDGEAFVTEYVTDKSWSGYNWYQGGSQSLIQVNTDLPIYIERAIGLGCHEGYPGHHVYNALLESEMVVKRGWIEFSVYPLYSPQSLLAEGTANLGKDMAFPGTSRGDYERETLYPLAGLDPALAPLYTRAKDLMTTMRYSRTEIARRYLDGKATREEAIQWIAHYGLNTRERAEQSVRFIEEYRGYIINYTLGLDLSADYVARNSDGTSASRWAAYKTLLSTPMTASMLDD